MDTIEMIDLELTTTMVEIDSLVKQLEVQQAYADKLLVLKEEIILSAMNTDL